MDGNWTTWTDWDTCTTTCYAVGTQERTRDCTNPTPVGHGLYCVAQDWEIQNCVPYQLPICEGEQFINTLENIDFWTSRITVL